MLVNFLSVRFEKVRHSTAIDYLALLFNKLNLPVRLVFKVFAG